MEAPEELFLPANRMVIGLTIDPGHLLKIRTERLKTLGLPPQSKYASMDQIKKELRTADQLMQRLDCPIINVSDKSIEETAGIIMKIRSDK